MWSTKYAGTYGKVSRSYQIWIYEKVIQTGLLGQIRYHIMAFISEESF